SSAAKRLNCSSNRKNGTSTIAIRIAARIAQRIDRSLSDRSGRGGSPDPHRTRMCSVCGHRFAGRGRFHTSASMGGVCVPVCALQLLSGMSGDGFRPRASEGAEMQVKHVMTQPAVTCPVNATLDAVARCMWECDLGAIPLVDDTGRIAGVVTDRDICM